MELKDLGLGLVDMEVEAVSVLELYRNEDVEESIDREPETILLSADRKRERVCVCVCVSVCVFWGCLDN